MSALTTLNWPMVASVMEEGFQVVINKGSEAGVKTGDKFLLVAIGPEIQDPVTGESLGNLELVRGRGIVVRVQEKMSVVESIETTASNPSPKNRIIGGLAALGAMTIPQAAPFNKPRLGDFAKPI